MTDRTMTTFGKLLRRSTGDLFDLQIGTYVSCSRCLMFDSAQVVTYQDEEACVGGVQYTPHLYCHLKVRKLLIGLYKNQTVGSFLVMYNDDDDDGVANGGGREKKKTPLNIVWLKKGCIVTKGVDGGSHGSNSLTLHCSEMGDVKCTFECSNKSKKWYKSIRSELNNHHSNNNDSDSNNNDVVSRPVRNNADQIFTIEKQGCLRQCSKRSSSEQSRLAADLKEMFIGTTYF